MPPSMIRFISPHIHILIMTLCPACGKHNAYLVGEHGNRKVVCRNCDYDERFTVIPSQAGKKKVEA
jgi:RNase P subunit RPR2